MAKLKKMYGVQIRSISNLPHVTNDSPHCNLEVWANVQCHGDGHHSLVRPESVFSEYNEDFVFEEWEDMPQLE